MIYVKFFITGIGCTWIVISKVTSRSLILLNNGLILAVMRVLNTNTFYQKSLTPCYCVVIPSSAFLWNTMVTAWRRHQLLSSLFFALFCCHTSSLEKYLYASPSAIWHLFLPTSSSQKSHLTIFKNGREKLVNTGMLWQLVQHSFKLSVFNKWLRRGRLSLMHVGLCQFCPV